MRIGLLSRIDAKAADPVYFDFSANFGDPDVGSVRGWTEAVRGRAPGPSSPWQPRVLGFGLGRLGLIAAEATVPAAGRASVVRPSQITSRRLVRAIPPATRATVYPIMMTPPTHPGGACGKA